MAIEEDGVYPKPFRSRLLIYCHLGARTCLSGRGIGCSRPHDPLIPKFTNHLVTTKFGDLSLLTYYPVSYYSVS
jgi:hypothetical protein